VVGPKRFLLALVLATCLGAALAQTSSNAAQQRQTQRNTLNEQLQHNVFTHPLVPGSGVAGT